MEKTFTGGCKIVKFMRFSPSKVSHYYGIEIWAASRSSLTLTSSWSFLSIQWVTLDSLTSLLPSLGLATSVSLGGLLNPYLQQGVSNMWHSYHHFIIKLVLGCMDDTYYTMTINMGEFYLYRGMSSPEHNSTFNLPLALLPFPLIWSGVLPNIL